MVIDAANIIDVADSSVYTSISDALKDSGVQDTSIK